MSYTIRATTDYAFDVIAQTDDREFARLIFTGLVLTNVYAQVEVEDGTHTVVEATYPLDRDDDDRYSYFSAPYGIEDSERMR